MLFWNQEGSRIEDVVTRLRMRTVPSGYTIHNWIDGKYTLISCLTLFDILGKDETLVEKLRSIMAQLEYQYQINAWSDKGIHFKELLYVPEVHPLTGMEFYEREDEGHILKVILYCHFLCCHCKL